MELQIQIQRAEHQGRRLLPMASGTSQRCLTQVVPFRLGMFMNMFLCETAKEDTVEARVKPLQVDTTNMTDARLGLKFREEN